MAQRGEGGEVKYVFDASAVGVVLERLKARGLKYLEGTITLDLALYELGNLFWKACYSKKAIGEEEALEGARGLAKVFELMRRERLRVEDAEGVMALALRLGLTFYDASYLYLAKSRGGVFVTEDAALLNGAKAVRVKAIKVEEYLAERASQPPRPARRGQSLDPSITS